jgi:hypothetical protein
MVFSKKLLGGKDLLGTHFFVRGGLTGFWFFFIKRTKFLASFRKYFFYVLLLGCAKSG